MADELKESLILAIKIISENVDLYSEPDSASKLARAINDISFALSVLDDLGITEKSERNVKVNQFLDAVKLYGEKSNTPIGNYIIKNSDAYVFGGEVCISGFEISQADTKEKLDALIALKFNKDT